VKHAAAVRRSLTEPGWRRLSRNARANMEMFDWSAVLPQRQGIFYSLQEGSVSHD